MRSLGHLLLGALVSFPYGLCARLLVSLGGQVRIYPVPCVPFAPVFLIRLGDLLVGGPSLGLHSLPLFPGKPLLGASAALGVHGLERADQILIIGVGPQRFVNVVRFTRLPAQSSV